VLATPMYHDSTKLPTSYHDTPNGEPINLYAYTLQVKIIQLKTKKDKKRRNQNKERQQMTSPSRAQPCQGSLISAPHCITSETLENKSNLAINLCS